MPKIFSVQSGNSAGEPRPGLDQQPVALDRGEPADREHGAARARAGGCARAEIGLTAFGRIATRARSGSGNQSRNSGRSTVIASKCASAAMRRAPVERVGVPALGVGEVVLGHVVQRGDPAQRVGRAARARAR